MFPGVAALDSYGGAKEDYSAPRDSTTDRTAKGVNPAFADVAAMTHCAPRAWVLFKPNGTGSPTLVAWDAGWKNGKNADPVVTRVGGGSYEVTFPAIVQDEIPNGSAGASPAGITLNLRFAVPVVLPLAGVLYQVGVLVQPTTSPNAVGVAIATVGTSTPADPNDATTFGVVVF